MAPENSKSIFRWRVLPDRAVERAQDDSFGIHAAFAQMLYELAQQCASPFAVGLYSGWGTGKTSVARMLEEQISADKPRKVGYVYLDVWKYVSDPLKRWILLETERQLQEQALLPADYKFNGRSLESYLEFEEQWEEEGQLTLNMAFSSYSQTWLWLATLLSGSGTALLWMFADQIPRILRLLTPFGRPDR
jgi:KAP family P-loop domain